METFFANTFTPTTCRYEFELAALLPTLRNVNLPEPRSGTTACQSTLAAYESIKVSPIAP